MAHRTFKGVLGIVEPIGLGACAFCGAHLMFPSAQTAGAAQNRVLASYDLIVGLIGLCALVYTQILRYRIGRDPALAETYFKPLPDGEVQAAAAPAAPASPAVPWEWTPMAKLTVGLAVIAVLAGVLMFAAHRQHAAPAAEVSGVAAQRQLFDETAEELNKLVPHPLNADAEFAEAHVTGMGLIVRYKLLRVNKTQITRSGGIPGLTKYSRSFLCNTAASRNVLNKGFLITNEYYDADGLNVTSFPTQPKDCIW